MQPLKKIPAIEQDAITKQIEAADFTIKQQARLKRLSVIADKPKIHQQFVIDRSSPVAENIYKKICINNKKVAISACRMRKSHLLAFLSRRYKASVARIICKFFDFTASSLDFEGFICACEQLMNQKRT